MIWHKTLTISHSLTLGSLLPNAMEQMAMGKWQKCLWLCKGTNGKKWHQWWRMAKQPFKQSTSIIRTFDVDGDVVVVAVRMDECSFYLARCITMSGCLELLSEPLRGFTEAFTHHTDLTEASQRPHRGTQKPQTAIFRGYRTLSSPHTSL